MIGIKTAGKLFITFAVLLLVCIMAVSAYAVIPQTINYQGYLTDSTPAADPVNGTVSMTFKIYNVATAGTALWTETQAAVQVSNGIYNVVLGSVTPVDLSFNDQYYLGIQVGADNEMTPRQPLTVSPYAFRAREADGVADGSITDAGIRADAAIQAGKISGLGSLAEKSTVGSSDITDGAITNADINAGAAIADSKLATISSAGKVADTALSSKVVLTDNIQTITGAKTFSSDLTLTSNLNLPATTTTTGIIRSGANTLIHAYGTDNFFAGINAGNLTTTGNANTASGTNALSSNTTGFNNTAIGYLALDANTGGHDNTAIGLAALGINNGSYSTAIGMGAGSSQTTGGGNIYVGVRAGDRQTTGINNIYVGNDVHGVAGESFVTRIGNGQTQAYIAGTVNADGFVGDGAGLSNVIASNVTGIVAIANGGTGSGTQNFVDLSTVQPSIGGNKTFTGYLAAAGLSTTGNLTLPATTAGGAAGVIKSGTNTLIHTYGSNNFFAGINAGMNLYMTGTYNTAVGTGALTANTGGSGNTATGSQAMQMNTTSAGNTAMGVEALRMQAYSNGGNPWFTNNTAVGAYALNANNPTLDTNGINNTALGFKAGVTAVSANANVTGLNNTFIGAYSGPGTSTQLTNATAIGYKAAVSQNNSLVLGGTGVDAVKVGIGTTAPTVELDVVGNVRTNKKDIYFTNDTNHGVGWYGTGKLFAGNSLDGPAVYGWSGGALGTMSGGQKVMLKWDTGNFDLYGFTRFHLLSGGASYACLDTNNTLSTCSSDLRLKKEVVTLSEKMDVLDALSNLRGVSFKWDTSKAKAENMGSGQDIGMIAQEVEAVLPEIVHTDADGYKSMDYPKLTAFLIEVNKAQQKQLDALKKLVCADHPDADVCR